MRRSCQRVEIGKWHVHEESLTRSDDRTPPRDSLVPPARESSRLAIHEALEAPGSLAVRSTRGLALEAPILHADM
jgi:hypothetical protein